VVLSWENLYAYNRKILDPTAERFFFVQNPIELTVQKAPKEFDVKLHLHPEHPERGSREYIIKPEGENGEVNFWVSSKDVDGSKIGNIVRLMELFNIRIEKANIYSAEASFMSDSYDDAKKTKAQLIHWIPVGKDMPCKVVMQDAAVIEGVAEGLCRELKPDMMIQFERFGFVRIDDVGKKLTVYYSHK